MEEYIVFDDELVAALWKVSELFRTFQTFVRTLRTSPEYRHSALLYRNPAHQQKDLG
jgi:hypothetical protein